MSDSTPIPVRLSDPLVARLDDVAEKMGTNRAALIRFLVKTFVEHFEIHGHASLPLDWKEIMRKLDGRAFGQQKRFKHLANPAPEDQNALPSKPVKSLANRQKSRK